MGKATIRTTLALSLLASVASAQTRIDPASRYLFYLHGRIVEEQGAAARHPEFGVYDYAGIVRQFRDSGFTVVSEMRRRNTDPGQYADSVARQVRRLIDGGVPEHHITVVGGSKGAGIAMLVSTRMTAPVRYVLLAGCNESALDANAPRLHGDVLSIYEESDSLGRSCHRLFARSPGMGRSGEIRLQTGLKHGFIYRPLAAWIGPVVGWAKSPRQAFAPSPRACHSAAATAEGILIWGGARACGVDVTNDSLMWTWNGATWDSRSGPPVEPREDALLVADPGSDSLWLYGGRRNGAVHSDLWLFDGRTWKLLDANGAPGALEHAAAAFDREQRRLVIFGGAIGRTTSGRTWEWNGITWIAFDAQGPAPRVGHGMAWSGVDSSVVLYGGFGASQYRDLWRWDGARWSLLSSDGPTYTEGHVIAESERGISVAGPGLTEGAPVRIWDWDGQTFHPREGQGPAVRVGATATYDRRRGALVYWGGSVSDRPVEGNPVEFGARR